LLSLPFTRNLWDFTRNLWDFTRNLWDFTRNLWDFTRNLWDFKNYTVEYQRLTTPPIFSIVYNHHQYAREEKCIKMVVVFFIKKTLGYIVHPEFVVFHFKFKIINIR